MKPITPRKNKKDIKKDDIKKSLYMFSESIGCAGKKDKDEMLCILSHLLENIDNTQNKLEKQIRKANSNV